MTGDSDRPQKRPRRDVVVTAAYGFVGLGVTLALWPFISALGSGDSGDADVTQLDLDAIPVGSSQRVAWQGRPYVVRHRTADELARVKMLVPTVDRYARNENLDRMSGAADENRAVTGRTRFLVIRSTCTKDDCIVREGAGLEDGVGWICPCCASRFDASGRVVSGPAPENLRVPLYALRNGRLIIGAR